MRKKILSLGLATVLALSSVSMAFAADVAIETTDANGAYASEVPVDSTTKVPAIKVTVPTASSIGINPYQMEFKVGDVTAKTQIISADYYIKNESDVPIAVDVTVTGKIDSPSEAVFATAALKGNETTKSVFLYMEIGAAADDSTPASYGNAYDAKSPNQILVGTKAVTKKATVELAAGKEAPTYASYKFFGATATNPAKAWTDADEVGATVVFSFVPQVVPES